MTCMFADSFFSRSSELYERKLDFGLGLEPIVEKAGSLGRDMPAANLKAPISLLVLFRVLLLVLLLLLK